MKFQKQAYRHNPDLGIYGDCHRTAIACILDMDRDHVPHITHEEWADVTLFHEHFRKFLDSQGFVMVDLWYDGGPLADLLACLANTAKDVYYLLGGMSANGTDHTVVGCGGEIVHDPAIDNSGIVGPTSNGFYSVSFLIPKRFVRHE